MAKTVSAAFDAAQRKKVGKAYYQRILYRRRKLADLTYENDGTIENPTGSGVFWRELPQNRFKRMGDVKQFLDFPKLNEFRSQSVTLTLNNTNNFFIPHLGTLSFFGASVDVPDGFDPYLMQVRLEAGYQLRDGSIEYVPLFTGVAIDYLFRGDSGEVQVTLEADDRLLKDSDAQNVNIPLDPIVFTPATGDGVNKEFRTTATGVGRIDSFTVDGLAQGQGTYRVSDLNNPALGALVTTDEAVPAGLSVGGKGIAWKADQPIEDLVEDLLAEAGVTDFNVDVVTFSGGVPATEVIDEKTEWDDGATFSDVESDSIPGSIVKKWVRLDDFTDGDFTNNPAWATAVTGSGSISAAGNQLTANSPVNSSAGAYTIQGTNAGTWRFKLTVNINVVAAAPFLSTGFGFMLQGTGFNVNGYYLIWNPFSNRIEFRKVVAGPSIVFIGSVETGTSGSTSEWRITHDGAGTFQFYRDGVFRAGFVDTTYLTGSHAGIQADSTSDDTASVVLDDFYFANVTDGTSAFPSLPALTGTWESKSFDFFAAPSSYGALDVIDVPGSNGSIIYETRTSDDDISFDPYVGLGAGNQIQSTPRRYIQVRATLTQGDNDTQPEIRRIIINFTATRIFLTLANFSGKTVFDAIKRLAQLADYEFGFDALGSFFFRSKDTTGAAVIELNQENFIAALKDYRLGFDKVITEGQVARGDFLDKFGAAEAGEVFPTSEDRFKKRIRNESFSDILLNNDANLGTSRARVIRDNNFRPRKRMRLDCHIIPQLELSDRVEVTYLDDTKLVNNIPGDVLNKAGDDWLVAGEAEHVLALRLLCKVVGLIYQPDRRRCEVVVQEVLE